jgi:hypothetical protein
VTNRFVLTLVFFDCDHFCNCGLENTDVPTRKAPLAKRYHPGQTLLPTHPFNSPPRARARSATGRLGAKPNTNMLSAVPARPVRRTGFRPILSLNLPHGTPDENSAKANAEVTIPAYTGIFASSLVMLKSLIIKYAYGNMDIKAMGSQIRHIARNRQLKFLSNERVSALL